jgi:hypothetical protein
MILPVFELSPDEEGEKEDDGDQHYRKDRRVVLEQRLPVI